jgi:hypothetical protein
MPQSRLAFAAVLSAGVGVRPLDAGACMLAAMMASTSRQ